MANSSITAVNNQQSTQKRGSELPDNEDVGVFTNGIVAVVFGRTFDCASGGSSVARDRLKYDRPPRPFRLWFTRPRPLLQCIPTLQIFK